MKTMSRVMATALTTGVLAMLCVSQASAGCVDPVTFQVPFEFHPLLPLQQAYQQAGRFSTGSEQDFNGASIVGMWKVQFVSKGNTAHNPPIPDGAVIDFGYSQWHSDGTEFLNSGGRAPATQNFCMGVWQRTGWATYQLNHFALSYDAVTGILNAKVNIRETVTLDPSGNSYTGAFTIDVFDPKGNHVDHVAGQINAQRVTVDSTVP